MQEKFSSDPRLDQIARALDAATRGVLLASLAVMAIHIPAKWLGCY